VLRKSLFTLIVEKNPTILPFSRKFDIFKLKFSQTLVGVEVFYCCSPASTWWRSYPKESLHFWVRLYSSRGSASALPGGFMLTFWPAIFSNGKWNKNKSLRDVLYFIQDMVEIEPGLSWINAHPFLTSVRHVNYNNTI